MGSNYVSLVQTRIKNKVIGSVCIAGYFFSLSESMTFKTAHHLPGASREKIQHEEDKVSNINKLV
jgi:hypothetical protein